MIRDQTPAHNTITIEALAARVAHAVCMFLLVSSTVRIPLPIFRETETEAGACRAAEHVSFLVDRPG